MNSRRVANYSKIVVNPTTKMSSNLLKDVKNPDVTKHNTFVKTVTPNLGKCKETGMWDRKDQIKECEQCLQKSSPEYPYFYCDGSCTSKYELGGPTCSLTSLVAKNVSQCSKPCKQFKAPTMSSGCQDDFDCGENEKCSMGNCIKSYSNKSTPKPSKEPQISDSSISNIIKICSKGKNIKTCIDDLNKLNCNDVAELVKKNIEDSHKNGSYKNDRKNIIKSFDFVKNNTEIEDEEYNNLINTLKNLNCFIDEINYQYELDSNEMIKPINITDQKAHYISNLLKSDKKLESKLRAQTFTDIKNGNFSLIYIIIIIILVVIIILLLIFYRKNNFQTYTNSLNLYK